MGIQAEGSCLETGPCLGHTIHPSSLSTRAFARAPSRDSGLRENCLGHDFTEDAMRIIDPTIAVIGRHSNLTDSVVCTD